MGRTVNLFLWGAAALGAAAVGLAGASLWLQSPAGSRAVSSWLTAQVASQVPGTEIQVETLRLKWPPAIYAPRIHWLRLEEASPRPGGQWLRQGGQPLMEANEVILSVLPPPRFPASLSWRLRANVERLDLAMLDETASAGKWRASGFLAGPVQLKGRGAGVEEIDLRLRAQEPGGTLSSDLVERLLSFMPQGDRRSDMLEALRRKLLFHYAVGNISCVTVGEIHQLAIFLDGDHLLDVKIRIPRESARELIRLLKEVMG